MKKHLLFVLLVIVSSNSYGQFPFCNSTMIPDTGFRGQTLTTTITGIPYQMGYGSAPCNPSDIRLNQSSSGTTINAVSMSLVNDTLRATWDIPVNTPSGLYDLNLYLWSYDPFNGNCIVGPQLCTSYSVFGINVGLISGHVFYDTNQDSVYNSSDIYLSGKKVRLLPDNRVTFTDAGGLYKFLAGTGSYTVKLEPELYFNSVNADSFNVTLGGTNIDSVDFAVFPDSNAVFRKNISFNGTPRCNTVQGYNIYYYGPLYLPVNLRIKVYHSPNTPYTNSSMVPDSIVGDTIYYSVMNFNSGSGWIRTDFQIPAFGDSIQFYGSVETYSLTGILYGENSFYLNQTVRCSFDPNDKAASPQGEGIQHLTLFSDTLFYHIRFQNTGNDTAYDVNILDTLDANLDLNSLQFVSSSHPVIVDVSSTGIINFRFYNIMLPDSNVDEPGSNGYVNYTIRTLTGLPENTPVTNTAYIYFDQNAPVVTNTTENTFVTSFPVGIFRPSVSNEFFFYPNPFNTSVTIVSHEKNVQCLLSITDMRGRNVLIYRIDENSQTIDLKDLTPGMYIYKIEDKLKGRISYGKLIKQ